MGNAIQQFIAEDRKCRGCGYNLKGLKADGSCPECGLSIRRKKRGPRYSDQLVNAPIGWLQVFHLASVLTLVAFLVAIPDRIIVSVIPEESSSIPLVLMSTVGIVWWVGVMLLTRARPVMPSTEVDPRIEWLPLRIISRISQTLWVVAAAVRLFVVRTNASWASGVAAVPASAHWTTFARGLEIGAAGGMVLLLVHLSNLAFWASDSKLGERSRAAAWLVGLCAFHALLALLKDVSGWITGAWLLYAIGVVLYPVTTLCLLVVVWTQAGMAKWALFNHAASIDRDERMKERADRLKAEQGVINDLRNRPERRR